MQHIIFYPSGLEIASASLAFIIDVTEDKNHAHYLTQILTKIRQIQNGSAIILSKQDLFEIQRCVTNNLARYLHKGKVSSSSPWTDKQWNQIDGHLENYVYKCSETTFLASQKSKIKMQKYVSQPSDKLDDTYEVARWNDVKKEYEVIKTGYPTEQSAKDSASQLNADYERDLYEYEHQNELIDKHHGYAQSDDLQQRNSAREFFKRFPYQRDVCNQIIKDTGL